MEVENLNFVLNISCEISHAEEAMERLVYYVVQKGIQKHMQQEVRKRKRDAPLGSIVIPEIFKKSAQPKCNPRA